MPVSSDPLAVALRYYIPFLLIVAVIKASLPLPGSSSAEQRFGDAV